MLEIAEFLTLTAPPVELVVEQFTNSESMISSRSKPSPTETHPPERAAEFWKKCALLIRISRTPLRLSAPPPIV